jgi:hypothetical protein
MSMSTFLEIAKGMAVNIGEDTPVSVQDDTPFCRLAGQFINETGRELIRRVDWHSLNKMFTITGNGSNQSYALAPDHDRLIRGLCVTIGGNLVRGSLSQDEWMALVPSVGDPRYFMAAANSIRFYPYPASGAVVSISYQSTQWVKDANGNGKSSLMKDSDNALLPHDLLLRGAVYRWYRHAGRDFSDHLAEYEAQLVDYAQAEGDIRQP